MKTHCWSSSYEVNYSAHITL